MNIAPNGSYTTSSLSIAGVIFSTDDTVIFSMILKVMLSLWYLQGKWFEILGVGLFCLEVRDYFFSIVRDYFFEKGTTFLCKLICLKIWREISIVQIWREISIVQITTFVSFENLEGNFNWISFVEITTLVSFCEQNFVMLHIVCHLSLCCVIIRDEI